MMADMDYYQRTFYIERPHHTSVLFYLLLNNWLENIPLHNLSTSTYEYLCTFEYILRVRPLDNFHRQRTPSRLDRRCGGQRRGAQWAGVIKSFLRVNSSAVQIFSRLVGYWQARQASYFFVIRFPPL